MAKNVQNDDELRRLTHEMGNSLAYVATNLHLLDERCKTECADSEKLCVLVAEALEGAQRMNHLVRALRHLSWSEASENPAPPRADAPKTERRILVIDDETSILSAVERALLAHRVDTVTSAEDALQTLDKDNAYDLILCDVFLGGMSGMEFFDRLQQAHPHLDKRVVFMTAGGFTDEVRRFLSNVDNRVLHKPFDVKTLRWVVGQDGNAPT